METAPTSSDAHSCSRAGGVSADTVDLLVCAAVAYGVLSDAASEGSPTSGGVETRDELARLWSPTVTGVAVFDPGRVGGRPVVGVDPDQVVKSAHAYEAACGQDSGWMGSEAQMWLRRVGVAAMQQVPEYAAASWQWVRPAYPMLVDVPPRLRTRARPARHRPAGLADGGRAAGGHRARRGRRPPARGRVHHGGPGSAGRRPGVPAGPAPAAEARTARFKRLTVREIAPQT